MGELSKIEWTDHTFNPWIGCQKVSPGCDRCYAESMSKRYGWTEWGPHGERKRTSEANWKLPLRWAKAARESGKRPRVFCASLADVFDNQAPKQWRDDLWWLILNTQELDWLLLTKRPQNIREMLPGDWGINGPFPNVWLGTTCEDQHHYNKRWPILSDIPATIRFVSYEPAIGPLTPKTGIGTVPDWIICGGESGPGARLMHPSWARTLREHCEIDNIRFFMKQMTGKKPIPPDLMVRQFPR
jgi:protein gp37